MTTTTIARPSAASVLLALRAATGVGIGTATGFVVEHNGRAHLITNWHVATGRRSDTGAPLSPTAAVPTEISVLHNAAGKLGTWTWRVEPLYTREGAPRWREHPTHRRAVDVVALELTDTSGVDLHPHNPSSIGRGMAIAVTSGVSIVGFPFGLTGGGGFGIWVRGWIATEPDIDYDGRPCFLIDSRTRQGQSGSPVILYQTGGAVAMADGSTLIASGPLEEFLGVYSGRVSEESDLGFVWKAAAVREILENGVAGST